jgi:hypothetical protein
MLAQPARGRVVAAALEELRGLVAPGQTLLALPEGAGLNYWLRREVPTRHLLFLPPELEAFGGEEAILREIARAEPDFVALVHRPTHEFGVGPFGSDPRNGLRLVQWVRAHYQEVARVGAEPFRGRGPGVVILRRAAVPGAGGP